ncbi:SLAIN motif-containing protein 2 [Elysia marginata]|uniref:SLAIN motif-containing protein 2 n=1 Tax=Elysia marginata TaxID=1093978 RepID=A0AAV4GII8_9GAST|nr:SLAIN motif-containing protein 2 [Elysia marginata]
MVLLICRAASLSNGTNSQLSEERLLLWVRQDFDHPIPEVASSRRDLLNKLDEAAHMRHSSSSPLLASQTVSSKSTSSLSQSAEESRPRTPPHRNGALGRPGFVTPAQKIPAVNTGTFTRPKRPSGSTVTGPIHGEGDQPQHLMDGSFTLGDAADISDIENLAKQQEANLRQNLTPANRKATRPKQALLDGENGHRLSPSRFDLDGSYLSRHRGSQSSEHSTPPDSPHQTNQNFQLNSSHAKDSQSMRIDSLPALRGSLQRSSLNSSDSSLERNSVHSANSDDGQGRHHQSKLAPEAHRGPPQGRSMLPPPSSNNYRNAQQQSRRALPSGLTRPQQRGVSPNNDVTQRQQQRGVSPQRLSAAGPEHDGQRRGVSPQRGSGLPMPRRQIMKPGSIAARSSLPQFRR